MIGERTYWCDVETEVAEERQRVHDRIVRSAVEGDEGIRAGDKVSEETRTV
jgi:hypothetical protein